MLKTVEKLKGKERKLIVDVQKIMIFICPVIYIFAQFSTQLKNDGYHLFLIHITNKFN